MNLIEMTIEEIELLKPSVFYTKVPYSENFILVPIKIVNNGTLAQWHFEECKFLVESPDTFEQFKQVLKEHPDNYYFYVEDSTC